MDKINLSKLLGFSVCCLVGAYIYPGTGLLIIAMYATLLGLLATKGRINNININRLDQAKPKLFTFAFFLLLIIELIYFPFMIEWALQDAVRY